MPDKIIKLNAKNVEYIEEYFKNINRKLIDGVYVKPPCNVVVLNCSDCVDKFRWFFDANDKFSDFSKGGCPICYPKKLSTVGKIILKYNALNPKSDVGELRYLLYDSNLMGFTMKYDDEFNVNLSRFMDMNGAYRNDNTLKQAFLEIASYMLDSKKLVVEEN